MSELLNTLHRHAKTQPAKPALVGNGVTITYGELTGHIDRLSRVLITADCRVAGLTLDNGPDWVLWDLACVNAGVICVPLPVFFTGGQRDHAIRAAGTDALITPSGIVPTGAAPIHLPDGTAKVTFTSGTTGAPKGVCLSQRGLETIAASLHKALGNKYAGIHFSTLPLGVLLENVAGVYTALLAGSTCHISGLASIGFANPFSPDFGRLRQALQETSATTTILVPEILRGLMGALAAEHQLLPSLRFVAVGGAKVDISLISAARRMGLPVYEGYGLSECGSVVALNTPDANMPGTAGRVLEHVKLHLDRTGEIVIDNALFLGYTDGAGPSPFPTGDLGHLDKRGFLSIQGRVKNILITSYGRNISPEWIESILLAQPEIAQAVVYGDALPRPRALLAPAFPAADVLAALTRVNTHLPEYARVDRFHIVAPFSTADGTLTANGRPRRAEILKRYTKLVKEEDTNVLRSSG